MTLDPASFEYVPAAHTSSGSNLPPSRVVVHGTVSPLSLGAAMRCARYFQMPSSGGSAHAVVDETVGVTCVLDEQVAQHAPPNLRSLGIELCDMVLWDQGVDSNGVRRNAGQWQREFAGNEAAFHARWDLPAWDRMLRLAAARVRAWCLEFDIPMVRLTPADLLAGGRGICGHVDVSNAWHQTDHTDPGPDFPWGRFMTYVQLEDPMARTLTDDDVKAIVAALVPALLDAPITKQPNGGTTSLRQQAEWFEAVVMREGKGDVLKAVAALPKPVAPPTAADIAAELARRLGS